ncbi:MAG: NVEALA domain-containing protein [Phocaeicola sp.]|nr:NVEALA domain-containing protein [Phocaeicola sp.]
MKKSVFKFLFATAFTLGAGYSVYSSQQDANMSNLAMANVEALANWESEIKDLVDNCTWQESSYCFYVIVTPSGNTSWSHWNMRNYY